jgi:hypothetical protein
MEHLSSDREHPEHQQVEWRRDKVQELCSKGYSQRDITNIADMTSYSKYRYITSEE